MMAARVRELVGRRWPALVVVLAIAWQYRAPLVGRVWHFEDIAAYFVPLYAAAARSMHFGQFPVWDLGAWSGQPLVGDPQLGLFYPPNWLWMLIKPVRLYAWLQLFHVAVGAGGMWALARARGRSNAAAAVAALSLALGAFNVLELRHAMFVASTAWVPWILCGLERYAARRRVDDALFVGLAGALAILAGGWSMLLWGAAVIAIYAVAVTTRAADRSRLVVGLALAALLAFALAAVQLAPALSHAAQSPRALGATWSFASSYGWPSWRYVLTLFVPTLYGDDARGTYSGAPDQWELCGYSSGAVAGLLALASLFGRPRRGERVALLVAVLLACDLARGAGGALHPLLFKLPLFSSLRCPARALYVWTLAAPILAADGLDTLVGDSTMRARWLAPLAVVAIVLELTITFRAENPSTTFAAAEARPAAIDWLRGNAAPGRATNDVHLGNAMHNFGLRWRVESAGGYHSLPIWRYLHLLWIANHGAPYPHAQLDNDLTGQGLWRFESPIVDLLSVSYVVAPRDRPIAAPGFLRVFAGDDGIDVWHNVDAYPRAFVVYRAQRVDGEAAAARAVAERSWKPSRVAIVEEAVDLPAPDGSPSPLATTPVRFVREGPTTLTLEVPLERPGMLIITEPWYPGWRVTVDGKPATLHRVDYALRGVRLDAGTHEVDFEITSMPLRAGAVVTMLALLVAGAVNGWDARRRRRRRS
ncbi:MAG: conserved rane protein of unknown function [Myxococcales bacterium]|nr:conserved rane protein of unknown function [Myxococcales bacterium]